MPEEDGSAPVGYGYIDRNLARVQEEIAAACREAGRDPSGVTLLAAIKSADVGEINYLHRHCGVCFVGENRVQQLTERYDRLERDGLHLHFIGTLQTNKVKYIIDKVDMVESLDSPGLARELQRQAEKHGRVVDVLIEINIGREPAKSGVLPEDAEELKGDAASYRRLFGEMRRLSESLWELTPGRNEPMVLSMGMSDSYRYAVAEGATLVRVGRALFARGDSDTE